MLNGDGKALESDGEAYKSKEVIWEKWKLWT